VLGFFVYCGTCIHIYIYIPNTIHTQPIRYFSGTISHILPELFDFGWSARIDTHLYPYPYAYAVGVRILRIHIRPVGPPSLLIFVVFSFLITKGNKKDAALFSRSLYVGVYIHFPVGGFRLSFF